MPSPIGSNAWILPVTVGRTHEGREVGVAIGTFFSEAEALQWGVKLVKEGRVTGFVEPIPQMTLKQYDAWKAAQALENGKPGKVDLPGTV